MSDIGECARCLAPMHPLAAFCKHCGLVVARKQLLLVPDALQRLATRQRSLMGVFGLVVALHLVFAVQARLGLASLGVTAVAWLILVMALMLCVVSLTDALRFGVAVSVLVAVLCLVPLVNLVVVIWLLRRAVVELRTAGVRVRLMGATSADVEVIAYVHRCQSCGYVLRGLTSLKCPECGLAFTAPMTDSG